MISGKPDPSSLGPYPGKSIPHLEWEGAGPCQDALPQGAFAGPFMDSRAWEDRGHWVKGRSFLGGSPRQSKAIQVLAVMPCLQHTDVLRGVLGESSSSPLLPEAPVHSPSVTAHHPFSHLLFNLTSPKGKVRILNRIDPEKGFQAQ